MLWQALQQKCVTKLKRQIGVPSTIGSPGAPDGKAITADHIEKGASPFEHSRGVDMVLVVSQG